ncbi:MAG: acyl-CoA dehydratase activase [Bacilli bacterium]
MITLGIDIGSTTSKVVILKDGQEILATSLLLIGTGTKGPVLAMNEALMKSGLKREDIDYILATGYGRKNFTLADSQVSELSCHAKGVNRMYPQARTIIDIGGQDAKVIQLSENGKMLSFQMNDKCAAGTGRFLSVMAKVLDISLEDMDSYAHKSKKTVALSSTCTVFAESEVISLLSDGIPTSDIVAAIDRSIAVRVGALALRLGIQDDVIMTGGVARNSVIAENISTVISKKVIVSEMAQLNGAFGAAILAYERVIKDESSSAL